jgi:hypothetical protein
VLKSGEVVLVGGVSFGGHTLSAVEKWDPETNTSLNPLPAGRRNSQCITLASGDLVVVGGWSCEKRAGPQGGARPDAQFSPNAGPLGNGPLGNVHICERRRWSALPIKNSHAVDTNRESCLPLLMDRSEIELLTN